MPTACASSDLDLDRELGRRASEGDGAAFAELFARHGERIHTFCSRVLRDPDAAGDATQEAFLNVLVRLRADAEPIADLRAYLFTAARHACLRSAEHASRAGLVDAVPDMVDRAALPEPEVHVLTSALQDAVRAANSQLPVRQREVLVLRELEGLRYDTIGEIMELDANAAAQLAWRARRSLRTALRRAALGAIASETPACERALTLLGLEEDGPLGEHDGVWLHEHLGGCRRCEANRAGMAEAGATYRLWHPSGGAPAVKAALLARAGEIVGGSSPAPGGGSGGRSVPPAVAAVVLAAILATGAFAAGLRPGGGSAGPASAQAASAAPANAAAPAAPAGGGSAAAQAPTPAAVAGSSPTGPPAAAPVASAPAGVVVPVTTPLPPAPHATPVTLPPAPQAPVRSSAPSTALPPTATVPEPWTGLAPLAAAVGTGLDAPVAGTIDVLPLAFADPAAGADVGAVTPVGAIGDPGTVTEPGTIPAAGTGTLDPPIDADAAGTGVGTDGSCLGDLHENQGNGIGGGTSGCRTGHDG